MTSQLCTFRDYQTRLSIRDTYRLLESPRATSTQLTQDGTTDAVRGVAGAEATLCVVRFGIYVRCDVIYERREVYFISLSYISLHVVDEREWTGVDADHDDNECTGVQAVFLRIDTVRARVKSCPLSLFTLILSLSLPSPSLPPSLAPTMSLLSRHG